MSIVLFCYVTDVLSQQVGTKEYYDKDGPFTCRDSPERITVPHNSEYASDSRSSGGKFYDENKSAFKFKNFLE